MILCTEVEVHLEVKVLRITNDIGKKWNARC